MEVRRVQQTLESRIGLDVGLFDEGWSEDQKINGVTLCVRIPCGGVGSLNAFITEVDDDDYYHSIIIILNDKMCEGCTSVT